MDRLTFIGGDGLSILLKLTGQSFFSCLYLLIPKMMLTWKSVRLTGVPLPSKIYGHSLPTTDSRRADVSYWWKDVRLVLMMKECALSTG